MKHQKIKYFLTFIFVFFCLIMTTNAETKYVTLLSNVNIRKGPATTYTAYATGSVGSTYTLKSATIVADTAKNGNCDEGWYEINYNGSSAYVCSNYVKVSTDTSTATASTTCQKQMQAAGFPSTYWDSLCTLQSKHSNWTFKALKTNLDWATAVEKESACGRSKIISTNSSMIDSTCKADEGSFKAASQTAVAFYMDPRNFLTENYIFQFEYLKYDNSLSSSYTTAVAKMLAPTSFYQYHVANKVDFAGLTNTAGKELNINPISLGSRMYQELGTTTTLYNLYSGVYTGSSNSYYGYYNFYNIGVTSSCVNSVTTCGLQTAKNNGWDTPYKAIKGGASLLANNYLAKGQYTTYLQKFNVVPTNSSSLYLNQYMTNIQAPSSESNTTYKTYSNLGLLNNAFVFYIPVYTNMSATISNSSNGASSSSSSSTSTSTSSITSIISSAGYSTTNSYITGIKPNQKASTLKSNLEAKAGSGNVTIKNASGKTISDALVGTGAQVTIKNSSGSKTYTVVIKGDTSGDGKINALDLLQIQKNILGTYKLSGAYLEAADTSKDSKVNALDLLQVQKSILGTYTIVQ